MLRTCLWQPFLTLVTAVIMASAVLAMPLAAFSGADSRSPNIVGVDKHAHCLGSSGLGCCTASHCCPVLPEAVGLVVPATSRSVPNGAVQLDQPLLLVRSLHPPPRGLFV